MSADLNPTMLIGRKVSEGEGGMEISNLLNMDSKIVIGIINERLRLECSSMDELVSRYELDADALTEKMATLGYRYDPISNQFK